MHTRKELLSGSPEELAKGVLQHLADLRSSGAQVGHKPMVCLLLIDSGKPHVDVRLSRNAVKSRRRLEDALGRMQNPPSVGRCVSSTEEARVSA